MASDDEAPKLNSSLALSISWTLRVANGPRRRVQAELPRDAALVGWLLRVLDDGAAADGEIEISAEVLEAALAKGILVTAETDPGEDVAAFSCPLDPALLELVPIADRAAAAVTRADDLVLNPRRWLQTSAELPREIAGRVVLDESLRSRAGHFDRGPHEGVPRGFGPLGAEGRLWVERPETGVLQPYDLDRSVAGVVAALASGALASRDVRAPLLATLVLADVLVSETRARTDLEIRRAAMREQLARQQYLVIPGIVSPLLVAALRWHFRALRRAGHLETDSKQVKGKRDGLYCEFLSVYVQDQLGRSLSGVVPGPIKPSYTWFQRYHSGAVLERHRDRPQCRWNVSFDVDSEPEMAASDAWPIHFLVEGETRSVKLGLGDAVLYSGTEVEHWRDALPPGETAGMCFLHYVDAAFAGDLG